MAYKINKWYGNIWDDVIAARAPVGGTSVPSYESIKDSLSRAQNRNVETLNNVIENNLKEHDFSGTLKDLQGDPIPKPGGGFWDHKTEMIQSYDALKGIKNGLEGSLQNPNLDSNVRTFLESELGKADSYIQRIEDLFNPFGGIG